MVIIENMSSRVIKQINDRTVETHFRIRQTTNINEDLRKIKRATISGTHNALTKNTGIPRSHNGNKLGLRRRLEAIGESDSPNRQSVFLKEDILGKK